MTKPRIPTPAEVEEARRRRVAAEQDQPAAPDGPVKRRQDDPEEPGR